MVLSELIPFIQIQLKILEILGVAPFAFKEEIGNFKKIDSRNGVFFKMKLGMIFCFVAFTSCWGLYTTMFASFEEQEKLGLHDLTYRMFVLFFTIVFPTVSVTVSPLYILSTDIITVLNFMLVLEQEALTANNVSVSSRRIRWVKLLLASFTNLSVTGPLCVTFFNAYQPSLLPFLGSVLPDVSGCAVITQLLSSMTHLVIIIFQTWLYITVTTASYFIIVHIFLMLALGLNDSLKVMMR